MSSIFSTLTLLPPSLAPFQPWPTQPYPNHPWHSSEVGIGQGPSPTGTWEAATLLRRVRKINHAGMARPQGQRPSSVMDLFHCGGVTSAPAPAPSTARVCQFAFPASHLLSSDSLSWEPGKRDDPQPSRFPSAPRFNHNLEFPPSTQPKGIGLMAAPQNPM